MKDYNHIQYNRSQSCTPILCYNRINRMVTMKYRIISVLSSIVWFLLFNQTFATTNNIKWELWNTNQWIGLPTFWDNSWSIKIANPHWFISLFIAEGIKYVWMLAVISLTIWWMMYITSYWVEAKTKKAKYVVMYSIIWVLISLWAYSLVEIVNNFKLY